MGVSLMLVALCTSLCHQLNTLQDIILVKIDLSFLPMLFIVLLVLKMTGVANLTWFWVFFPLWIPLALIPLFFLVTCLLYLVLDLAENW